MRCKACNSIMDDPKWNKDLGNNGQGDWELCTVCLEIVFSCFEDYPDLPESKEVPLEDIDELDTELLDISVIDQRHVRKPLTGQWKSVIISYRE